MLFLLFVEITLIILCNTNTNKWKYDEPKTFYTAWIQAISHAVVFGEHFGQHNGRLTIVWFRTGSTIGDAHGFRHFGLGHAEQILPYKHVGNAPSGGTALIEQI